MSGATVLAPAVAAAPSASGPQMTVLTSFDEAWALRSEWDALASELRSPAYLSFDHCAAWWTRYGPHRELRVFVFRSGGALTAIVPTYAERVWLGPVGLRIAGIVGSDSTPVVLDLPVRADPAADVFEAVLRHLLGPGACDAVKFAPLAGESVHAAAIRDAAGRLGRAGRVVRDADLGPHTVFELPTTFREYLDSLDKKQRSNHKRAMKALAAAARVDTVCLRGAEEIAAELPKFIAMHEAQWRAEGKLGHFRDWPGSEEYHAALVRAHGAHGRAHLLRLSLDGEPVSYQLCYSFGDTLHWVLPARVRREDLDRHSLGRLGVVQLVEYAISAGFRRIEAGIGHYDYKLQLGATERTARSVVVAGRKAGTRARLVLFSRLATALDVIYYRAWFKRIAPRLPSLLGPLWEVWIRSRL